jgi:steroid 5-alpha reductase family enzyme
MTLFSALLFSLVNLAILLALLTALWAVSVRIKDASIIDIAWGPACALPAVLTFVRSDGADPRALVLTVLVSLWAARLAWYLGGRNLGHGEDVRYQAMRKAQGSDAAFARWSLPRVFWLQGVIAWIVSLPVQWGQFGPDGFDPLIFIGAGIFAAGLAFETVGDWQLAQFKKDPANKGKLMTEGLWSWTRHPNYFGDACVWFGLTAIALESPLGRFTILSPVIMTVFLVFISGKALTEKLMEKKYPEYADYKKRTSGFIPLPPR